VLHKALQVRLYPTKEQQILLAQTFGSARWWWNYALNKSIEAYKETGKGLGVQRSMHFFQRSKKQKTLSGWLIAIVRFCRLQHSI
jgi:putative transposase